MLDTLANVKTRLGISTTEDDTFLTSQITLISDVIEAYCRRKFSETDWIETFYKESFVSSTVEIQLYHFPVSAVTALSIDGVPFDVTQLKIHKPTSSIRRKDNGLLYGNEVIVSYTAGYAAVPTPVLEVLDSLVKERLNKRKTGVDLNFGSDVQRVSIPGAISIDFDYSLTNNDRVSSYGTIIGSFANVLDDWRSERTVVGSGKLEYVEEDT